MSAEVRTNRSKSVADTEENRGILRISSAVNMALPPPGRCGTLVPPLGVADPPRQHRAQPVRCFPAVPHVGSSYAAVWCISFVVQHTLSETRVIGKVHERNRSRRATSHHLPRAPRHYPRFPTTTRPGEHAYDRGRGDERAPPMRVTRCTPRVEYTSQGTIAARNREWRPSSGKWGTGRSAATGSNGQRTTAALTRLRVASSIRRWWRCRSELFVIIDRIRSDRPRSPKTSATIPDRRAVVLVACSSGSAETAAPRPRHHVCAWCLGLAVRWNPQAAHRRAAAHR